MIHPTAVIDPKAEIHPTVQVGPYVVIEGPVVIGEGCRIGPQVHLCGNTLIGARNQFHAGAVIGDAPQDLKYAGAPTQVRIGNDNIFREHVTVHRSNCLEESTVIGSGNFFMASSHVGHNSVIGNQVIMANGALIAGHCVIEDRAFISGTAMVHQFTRVGRLALMQGGSGVSKDLPPFTISVHENTICGLNIIGLRRAGIPSAERLELKKLYHQLFRSNSNLKDSLKGIDIASLGKAAQELVTFVSSSKKGVCADLGRRSNRRETPEN